jgi:hypothetical protein
MLDQRFVLVRPTYSTLNAVVRFTVQNRFLWFWTSQTFCKV